MGLAAIRLAVERYGVGKIFEHGGRLVEERPVTCPECGARMVLRSSPKYQWPNGVDRLFYGCSRWPQCSATHGSHPDGRALGVPANKETKAARQRAHAQFDALLAEKRWTKKDGYHWLGQKLGMKSGIQIKQECHIAKFDKQTCDLVVILCAEKRASHARELRNRQFAEGWDSSPEWQ